MMYYARPRSVQFLAAVVGIHVLITFLLIRGLNSKPANLNDPVMVGVLIESSTEKAKPKPEPKITPRPTKTPAVEQTLSSTSRSTDTEPQEKVALPAPPVPSSPAASTQVKTGTPTIQPPRFDADYLHNPPPEYPGLSRRRGEQGRVVLRVYVQPDGRASKVELRESSGYARLDASAQAAVARWRFLPAKQGDTSIGAWVLVPISFSLRS